MREELLEYIENSSRSNGYLVLGDACTKQLHEDSLHLFSLKRSPWLCWSGRFLHRGTIWPDLRARAVENPWKLSLSG
jgi:hypothetical protein